MNGRLSALLVASVQLCACTRALDPCPEGMLSSEDEDRCIDAAVAEPEADADVNPPSPPAHPVKDAEADAAEPDAGSLVMDAGSDAGTDSGTAHDGGSALDAGDAAIDVDASVPVSCSPEDYTLWRDFHLSEQLVDVIVDCVSSDPSCALGLCPLDECLRETVGVAACEDCIEDEVRCVADNCVGACGAASDDAACRACACANGCVGAYDSCAGQALDVCADCNAETCWNMSLPAELIMVVVAPLLLH